MSEKWHGDCRRIDGGGKAKDHTELRKKSGKASMCGPSCGLEGTKQIK